LLMGAILRFPRNDFVFLKRFFFFVSVPAKRFFIVSVPAKRFFFVSVLCPRTLIASILRRVISPPCLGHRNRHLHVDLRPPRSRPPSLSSESAWVFFVFPCAGTPFLASCFFLSRVTSCDTSHISASDLYWWVVLPLLGAFRVFSFLGVGIMFGYVWIFAQF